MISREQAVTQSTQNFVQSGLVSLGYTSGKVFMRDAFPTPDERASELVTTTVATGFNFDDGGTRVELGSDLLLRVYTIEFWVFGTTPEYGQNVAHAIRRILEENYLVPLQDIRQVSNPVVDQLQVLEPRGVLVTHQINPDPRPWDMNVYTATVKLEDFYSPSAWSTIP